MNNDFFDIALRTYSTVRRTFKLISNYFVYACCVLEINEAINKGTYLGKQIVVIFYQLLHTILKLKICRMSIRNHIFLFVQFTFA